MTKARTNSGKEEVWDALRQKYVALTPEESVRQQFVAHLINDRTYSPTLMANEVNIELNGMKRRCDTVVYDRQLCPRMIIEYKRPDVEITQEVIEQIYRYNLVMKVDWLTVTNGRQVFCCRMNYETMIPEFLSDLPSWGEIVES